MAAKQKKSPRNKWLIASTLCVALVGGLLIRGTLRESGREDVGTTSESRRRSAPKFELPAPAFELKDALGHKVDLRDLRGNVVIVHFWASWCPPCLDEIPQWVELGTYFKGKPVKLLAISEDQNWEDAHKTLPSSKLPANITSLLDSASKVSDLFGTYQYPETYVLTPDLKIAAKWVGPQDWGGKEVRGFIEKLISVK